MKNVTKLVNYVKANTGLNTSCSIEMLLCEESIIHRHEVYKGNVKPFEKHYFLLAAGHLLRDYGSYDFKLRKVYKPRQGLFVTGDY